jgi:hypothetical protein
MNTGSTPLHIPARLGPARRKRWCFPLKMTIGCDTRPVTAFGSIRPSDISHDRLIGKTEALREAQVRRHYTEEVCEQIEDFEHKLGWRMRSFLGPRWWERRELEREEERTMGIKRTPAPRPKEELLHYDYASKSKLNPHDVGFTGSERRSSAPHDLSEVASTPTCRTSVQSAVPSNYAPSRPVSKGFVVPPARSVSAGPLRNSSRLWTPYSMIEPIFLPSSSTQKFANDQRMNRISLSSSAKWEDRKGKNFWDVKEQQLNDALKRTEGNKLGHAHFSGQILRKEHDRQVAMIRMKTRADMLSARERGEYYARCVNMPSIHQQFAPCVLTVFFSC